MARAFKREQNLCHYSITVVSYAAPPCEKLSLSYIPEATRGVRRKDLLAVCRSRLARSLPESLAAFCFLREFEPRTKQQVFVVPR